MYDGQWICITMSGKEAIGYVVGITSYEYIIQLTHPTRKEVRYSRYNQHRFLKEEETIDHIRDLIDVSLYIKDEQWFMELTNRLKQLEGMKK